MKKPAALSHRGLDAAIGGTSDRGAPSGNLEGNQTAKAAPGTGRRGSPLALGLVDQVLQPGGRERGKGLAQPGADIADQDP